MVAYLLFVCPCAIKETAKPLCLPAVLWCIAHGYSFQCTHLCVEKKNILLYMNSSMLEGK